ncbi:MAG: hypothetical protein LC798_21620 [Chloroflexi bacterium]|nr:hypothetical protein [Chloroflexota bacterium]
MNEIRNSMTIALRGKPTVPGNAHGCRTTKMSSVMISDPAASAETMSAPSATVG